MTTGPRAAADGSHALVLLVDDNPTNRYVLGTYLRRAGHRVMEAEDGRSALSLLRDTGQLPEAAVIDVRLPDMTGFEVCESVKADPRTAALPVILISASAISVTDRAQGLYRGADAYLTEPVAPNELLATVTAALRYARARQRAETLAARLNALNRATMDFYQADDAEELAERTALSATRIFGAPAAVVMRTPEDGLVQRVTTQDGGRDAAGPSAAFTRAVMGLHPPGEAGVRLDVLSTGAVAAPEALTAPELAVASAKVKGTGAAACVVLPHHMLSDDDHEVLTQLAHACVLSLEALRSYRQEHTLALTLQRTFLPVSLPATGYADVAVRYLPASQTAEIGGDFYEALRIRGGLLLAVGDVAGHSLDAAVVMGELRHALRAYALEGHPPHEILSRLDYLLLQVEAPRGATVCVILIEEDGRAAHIANAGHLPPALRHPGEDAEFVTAHGPMLGLGLPHPPAVRVPLRAGSQVVMVTDGLLERRGTSLDEALDRLRKTLSDAPADVEAVCELLLATFPPDGNDDIALLSVGLR